MDCIEILFEQGKGVIFKTFEIQDRSDLEWKTFRKGLKSMQVLNFQTLGKYLFYKTNTHFFNDLNEMILKAWFSF